MKRRALHAKHRPRSLNLAWFAVAWLLADRIGMPAWAWGVWCTLIGLIAIATLVDFFTAEDVELPE